MHNKFKNGSAVIICGLSKTNGKFYKNKPAIIVTRDSHFKDYLVKFKNGDEDWISPKDVYKPYSRRRRKTNEN